MGGFFSHSDNCVEMRAENAKLTFPHLQQVFDIQDQEIQIQNTRKKMVDYLVSGIDQVPADGISKGLIKYAITYICTAGENTQDPIDRKIERYISTYLYNQLSAEFGEIKRKLELIQDCMELNKYNEAYADVSYCISRCGVLLSLFLSNLTYALAMATLFKELCLVYIALGLVLAEYDALQKTHIIDRFNAIEEAVNKFKEATVKQRLKMFSTSAVGNSVEYTDQLRPDMYPRSQYVACFSTKSDPELEASELALAALAEEDYKELQKYKKQLEIIYNHYFDRIKFQVLDEARRRLATIQPRRAIR